MAYHVDLTARASRNLKRIYQNIQAADSAQAASWFIGLKMAILSLSEHPARCPVMPDNRTLRHLLYGSKPHVYRIIYAINERQRSVTVLHIRQGARNKLAQ